MQVLGRVRASFNDGTQAERALCWLVAACAARLLALKAPSEVLALRPGAGAVPRRERVNKYVQRANFISAVLSFET